MMIVYQAPLFLVLIFLAGLAGAAGEDVFRRRVSNVAVLAVALSGIAAFALTGHAMRLWEPLVVAVAVLAVGSFLFGRGLMGGGDVKLLAAGCFWFTLRGQLTYLAAALIAGGLLALVVLITRFARMRGQGRSLRKGSVGIPYAVAIALGAAWAVYFGRFA